MKNPFIFINKFIQWTKNCIFLHIFPIGSLIITFLISTIIMFLLLFPKGYNRSVNGVIEDYIVICFFTYIFNLWILFFPSLIASIILGICKKTKKINFQKINDFITNNKIYNIIYIVANGILLFFLFQYIIK